MAELATIARPYAEALFKSGGGDAFAWKAQLESVASLAADPQLRQFAALLAIETNRLQWLQSRAQQMFFRALHPTCHQPDAAVFSA